MATAPTNPRTYDARAVAWLASEAREVARRDDDAAPEDGGGK